MTRYSIIIPTFNRANLVPQAIDSVLGQTFKDYELIVCDDGSTDDTGRVLAVYGDRIRRLRTDRRGVAGARNMALAAARGEWISFLDSDDVWAPWTLECIDRVVSSEARECLVYLEPCPRPPDGAFRDPERADLAVERYRDFLSAPLGVPHGSCSIGAIPRQRLAEVGGFDEALRVASDHDLALRLGVDIPYLVITSPTVLFYRSHEGNLSRCPPEVRVASYERILAKELRERAYPGGRRRRHARRLRIGRATVEYTMQFVGLCEYRKALRLYRKAFPLLLSIRRWRFALGFPILVLLHASLLPTALFPFERKPWMPPS